MNQIDRSRALALLFSLIAVFAVYFISEGVFEQLPHIEDEMAYVWQAQVISKGQLTLPSPAGASSLKIPNVVDYNGQRFAKYPLGWPIVLAFGLLLNARSWVNPILAGLSVWFTYLLGKKLFDERVAFLASFLTLTSPFFLLNASMLFPHVWTLFLSLSFVLAWLDTFVNTKHQIPKSITILAAGLSLGVLAFTRPLTAVGVALPFVIHSLILILRGDSIVRVRVLVIGLLALVIGALIFAWQFAVTGDAFLNPYTLWWPYDKIGFGEGHGILGKHTLALAIDNVQQSFYLGNGDFFGWGSLWWIFAGLGMLKLKRNGPAWLAVSVFPSLVLVYMAYWVYTPRYYYEGLFSLTFLCALGILFLAEGISKNEIARKLLPVITLTVCILAVAYNFLIYLPTRFHELQNLYGINRAMLAPFQTEAALSRTPALVIIYPSRPETKYGGLLELQNADLTSPFIFALHRTQEEDKLLALAYPERRVIYYYFDEPAKLYDFPR